MVWWNEVSITPTLGRPGKCSCAAKIPLILAGLCSGASGMQALSSSMTAWSIKTDSLYFSPPCAMRWPMALIWSCRPCFSSSFSNMPTAPAWSLRLVKAVWHFLPSLLNVMIASGVPKRSPRQLRRTLPFLRSITAPLSEELPQFRTRMSWLDMVFLL